MKKITFKEGDLFFINDIFFSDGEQLSFNGNYRIGKLIYISHQFKNMIGFLPSNEVFSEIPKDISAITFSDMIIYTGNSELSNGNWKIIGYQDVSEHENNLTLRRVADEIFLKDNIIRKCAANDYKTMNRQLIAGLGAVHYYLTNLE